MGSILIIASRETESGRQKRLEAMATRSAYRGCLTTRHFPEWSLGIQSRIDDCALFESPDLIVACHGRIYDPSSRAGGMRELGSAERLAREWQEVGSRSLRKLDGDFAAFVHDRRTGVGYAFVSLSMARSLYCTTQRDLLVVASEVRQVAAGAEIHQTLDIERVVESLVMGGPVIAPYRTEYVGIDRLLAPKRYRVCTDVPRLIAEGEYWSPPQTEHFSAAEAAALPAEMLRRLATAVDSLPAKTAFSLSAGYDSGTLWAIAHRSQAAPRGFRAYTLACTSRPIDQEYAALCELLKQTQTVTTFINCDPEPCYTQAHARQVDRIPNLPFVENENLLLARASADGADCHVMGFGAELMLSTPRTYAADLLRGGQWMLLARDAFRFREYGATRGGTLSNALCFVRTALAPPGSMLHRVRHPRSRVPRWLHPHWQELVAEASVRYDRLAAREGYGRGNRWVGLGYAVGAGGERIEQQGERYGLELAIPYMHRSLVELGFLVPPRILNGGKHPKYALRRCASLALGSEPPWPAHKHRDASQPRARDLLSPLGDPAGWQLTEHGIVADFFLEDLRCAAAGGGALSGDAMNLVCKEFHLRLYGAAGTRRRSR
jgi:hypothetical protein